MVGSSLPRRALGRLLRQYRIAAGKGQLAAGLHVEISPQSIGRMEDGRKVKIVTSQIKDLLDLYGVVEPSEKRDEVLSLWQEVRQQDHAAKLQGDTKGWWRSYRDQFAAHFDHYLSLEASAHQLTSHQLALVPGLLQTPEYRRAMIRADDPNLSAVDVERRLELAARRRIRLDDSAFRLTAMLSEAVLRHQPGGCAVMGGQLRQLITDGERENVAIRIVPFGVGAHSGLVVQSFTLLEFPPLANRLVEPPVVYVEGYEGALFLEQMDVIDRHRRALSNLGQVALSEDDSRELVWRIAKEYEA
ncbi:helix-turn-helix domain-containing protein [Nocardia otitidiscaviarum]|uniref:helix-turn-helix domain-containing protein n=1 Tax=Nocardia otitidiscaviarum TaxID=1823 RepID=UPI00189444E2|nr:helix-turn-helix transcriptional regulator [Nocardia otitidiscaviarum]MBF6240888.1 helix-turn-helix domain-containing protein [Nocardia otitidiscaviarum]